MKMSRYVNFVQEASCILTPCNAGSLHRSEDLSVQEEIKLLYFYKILELLTNRSCLNTRSVVVYKWD